MTETPTPAANGPGNGALTPATRAGALRPRHLTDPGSGAVRVMLTEMELTLAFELAMVRQTMNLGVGARHYAPATKDGLWQHAKGVVGEIAASVYLGEPLAAFTTLGDYGAPDVAPNVQVRCTGRAGNPLRLYKQKDQDEHPFVLAVWDTDKSLTEVTLVGWAFKKAVAREAYWVSEHDSAFGGRWEIPAAELRPMSELAALHAEQRALGDLDRVAKYKAQVAERDRRLQPPPEPPPAAEAFEDRDF